MTLPVRAPFELGPLPLGRPMQTIDERVARASIETMFSVARDVELWPGHLPHYRYVRFRERSSDGGGIVEMSAYRPFAVGEKRLGVPALNWPTWWLSEMQVDTSRPAIRFRHIGGITTGMDVEWSFQRVVEGTRVRIVHVWDGPKWPLIGMWAATAVIGPVFIHGIASRTLSGLTAVAERESQQPIRGERI